MSDKTEITAADIRAHLLGRAEEFSARTGMSPSAISREAVKDDRFLARAKSGSNFTIETYQRFIDWLDAQEIGQPERLAS